MFRVEILCDGVPYPSFACDRAGWTTVDRAEPMPNEVWQSLVLTGWAERDGKHYCPRHDPTQQGVRVAIGRDYVELAPGVRARWPGAERTGDTFPIEVQHCLPNHVRAAVETLKQQRESDEGPGRYDMVDQRQIDVLIGYLSVDVQRDEPGTVG